MKNKWDEAGTLPSTHLERPVDCRMSFAADRRRQPLSPLAPIRPDQESIRLPPHCTDAYADQVSAGWPLRVAAQLDQKYSTVKQPVV